MARRLRSFFFDNKNGKLFTGVNYTLKDIETQVEGTEAIDGTKVSDFARSAIQTGAQPFLDNDTSFLTAAATDNRINEVVNTVIDSAPGALDTLNELAEALGDDANFSTTITNSIATKWTQDNTKISNWDTAYGWGDHSTAGYLTSIAANTVGITELNVTDGSNGQVLTTDGSGTLSFADAASGESFTASLFHTLDNPNAYDTGVNDNFGESVAISGKYAIVGVRYEDDAGGLSSGKAYIFDVTTGSLVHTLDNPNAYNTSAQDKFGTSVAISGNYAIIGASLEDDGGGTQSGKAYIYNVTTGALVHTLDNPNAYSTSAGDYFGESVAISGNYAIVGAIFEDDASGSSSGKAYIFNVTTGALLHTLDNPNAYDTGLEDKFGGSVAISGNYAIVGAWSEDDAGGSSAGKAYIYNVTTGTLLHTLDNPNAYGTSANDYFGNSVAISGNYAIFGAPYEEGSDGGSSAGKAYIYNVSTGELVHTLDNPRLYAYEDQFGYAVSISGNYAIVGAYALGYTYGGIAHIFNVTTGELVATLDNPNPYGTTGNDYFGYSVSISGNYAIVSAHGEEADDGTNAAGRTYIYQLSTPGYAPNADEFTYSLAAAASGGGGISELSEDTSPELGANLDTNGHSIGTGYANLSFYEDNAPGLISGRVIYANAYNKLVLSRGELIFTNSGDSPVTITTPSSVGSGYTLTLPTSAGANGQVLTTDGSGNLSFADASGGISNLVEDTTPQLGGNLDLQSNMIFGGQNGSGAISYASITGMYNGSNGSAGDVYIRGARGGSNTDGTVYIQGNATDVSGGSGNVYVGNPSSDTVRIQNLIYPSSDGTNGQVLTTNGSGTLSFASISAGSNNIGYLNIPAVGTKTSSYTLSTNDVGKYVQIGSGGSIVVPNSTFSEGDVVSIFNNTTGDRTITLSISTAYIGGTNTNVSSVTLATRGIATIFFISSTLCVINGNVS